MEKTLFYQKFTPERRITKIAVFLIFLLILLSAVVIIFTFSSGITLYDLHDYIEGIFWAEATLRSGALLAPDYIYYYTVPFGSNLIMAPFVHWFGSGYLANQLGMLVFFGIYLVILIRLSGSLFPDWTSRLVFCSVLSLFVYTYVGDNLLHHLLSYGIGFVCFMGGLSCVIDVQKGKGKASWFLLVLLCLWSSLNGIPAALSTVPILLGLLVTNFRNHSLSDRKQVKLYFVLTAVTLCGVAIYRRIDAGALSLHQYEKRLVLADADTLTAYLTQTLLKDYLLNFCYDPKNIDVFSLQGISVLLNLMAALLVPVLVIYLHRKSEGPGDDSCSLIKTANLFVIVICLAKYVLLRNTAMRYLFNGILSLFFLLAFDTAKQLKKRGNYAALIPLMVIVLLFTGKELITSVPLRNGQKVNYERVAETLNDRGLHYGYTTHRSYKVLELLSLGDIRDTRIEFNKKTGKFSVARDRIYTSEVFKPEEIREFFIVRDPIDNLPAAQIDLLEAACEDKLQIGSATIYIYDNSDWDKVLTE